MADDTEAQRIKDGKAGLRPFPYPQIGGMSVRPTYAVHGHHLDELVATIDRLTAEVERLKAALEEINMKTRCIKTVEIVRAALKEDRT